jgi:transposase
MNINNIPLLPAFVERAKDAARTVKQGVFVLTAQVNDKTLTHLLGLEQFEVIGYGIERAEKQNILHLYGEITTTVAICPCCHSLSTTVKESKERCVRDCDVWGKRTFLHFQTRRFECPECGHRFTEELKDIAWRRRQTIRFERQVYEACLGSNKKRTAETFHLSYTTVDGIFKRWAKKQRKGKQFGLVKVLGIDEISVKKRHKQFAVVISDLERHCVLTVLPDRKHETLKKWLDVLSDEQRAAIKTVSMDMWGPYRHFFKKHLPQARRVADRFHVMQQLNKQLGKARLAYQRKADEATQAALKGCRWLVLMNRADLSEKQEQKLMSALEVAPELKQIYLLKEEFRLIFERVGDKQQAQRFLQAWICKAQASGSKHLIAFIKTLRNWWPEILDYFDKRITNGFVEGINRAIRGIIWRAYGFRNFENFKLQILAEHGFS